MDETVLPLAGVKIVELSTFITGPYAGMLLADMGADVIKVERPDGGDPFRGYDFGNYSPQYRAYNRNKRSMTLKLGDPKAREILLKLVADADVVIENFRPGVTDKLEVGETALRSANPTLIYCSITGFGHDGPYRDRPAYDTVAQGFGGLLGQFIDSDSPLIPGPALADSTTGLYAALSVSNALVGRQRTGQGRRIDITMIEAITSFAAEPISQFLATGSVPTPYKRATIS
ncbi:MAG TPA: CaiB/BaiF CoA-transferase family protein, partial [Gammaproteobacteria bacterium]|nr:CaiB/BaiF CoA-transferase family protein [Gammaproteobacteria bacterium]